VNAGPKGPRGAALYAALKGRLFQNGRRVLDGEKVPLFHDGRRVLNGEKVPVFHDIKTLQPTSYSRAIRVSGMV
jgi:hypothetical protein